MSYLCVLGSLFLFYHVTGLQCKIFFLNNTFTLTLGLVFILTHAHNTTFFCIQYFQFKFFLNFNLNRDLNLGPPDLWPGAVPLKLFWFNWQYRSQSHSWKQCYGGIVVCDTICHQLANKLTLYYLFILIF